MSIDLNDKNSKVKEKNADEYSYQPRRRARGTKIVKESKPNIDKKINKLFFIIPGAVVVLILVLFLVYPMTLPKNVIASNVKIADVEVGGMTVEQAKTAIEGLIPDDAVYKIASSGNTTEIRAEEISLELDHDMTVSNAMNICKSKNIFVNSIDAVALLFAEKNLEAELKYNVENLDKILFDFGATFNGLSTKQQYTYTDNSLTVIPATPGQNPDVSVARGEFLSAVGLGKTKDIEVTLDYAEPKLLNPEEIYNEICVPAQNASYARGEDGQIIVNEHRIGVEVKKEDLKNVIATVNEGKSATCPAVITMPEKTKEDIEEKLFNATLGTYTTDFSSSGANRAHNVTLASNSINETILMPGDEFSYNNTIGNPNAARGYKVAGVYENGKVSEGVGGGVCQVSSTLYSAVLYADLEIVERHNHSLTVGYVPNGQDATVSYGVIDFRFKNNTEYPIKVKSVVNKRKLTISIIGTEYEPAKTVKISNETTSTISPTDNEKIDETLPAGTRKVVSKGKTGYVVNTYKTVIENGVQVSSKKITTSRYKMIPNEVLVGQETVQVPPVEGAPVENQPVIVPEVDEPVVEEPSDAAVTTEPQIPELTKPSGRPAPNVPENETPSEN